MNWIHEKEILKALRQMRGTEGGVFDRDMPLNVYRKTPNGFLARVGIGDGRVPKDVFAELVREEFIARRVEGTDWEQWYMTPKGLRALREACMDTKAGKLTRDDIAWLTGTGRFAQ